MCVCMSANVSVGIGIVVNFITTVLPGILALLTSQLTS